MIGSSRVVARTSTCVTTGQEGTKRKRKFLPSILNDLIPRHLFFRRRNKERGPGQNNRYAAAVYQCASGYALAVPEADRLYCRQGTWIGPSPVCVKKVSSAPGPVVQQQQLSVPAVLNVTRDSSAGACGEDKGGCEHICQEDPDGRNLPVCLCYRGYTLHSDGKSCAGLFLFK